MKRKMCRFAMLILILLFSSCSRKPVAVEQGKIITEQESLVGQKDSVEQKDSAGQEDLAEQRGNSQKEEEKIDLTQMSSTLVYAEVFHMTAAPQDYVGKCIRVRGQFSVYQNKDTGNNRYFITITDASACCSQDLEFVLAGHSSYPDDYPQPGEEITVTGKFETYEDRGYTSGHLVEASFEGEEKESEI